MKRSLLLIAALLLAGATGLTTLLGGCDSSPETPVYDNPFDPNSPTGGDPLDLSVTALDTTVIVGWYQPQSYDIINYDIMYSPTYGGSYLVLETVEHTSTERATYFDHPVNPTEVRFYKVRARAADNSMSLISEQVPAIAMTYPLVQVGDGSGGIASRYTDLVITVSSGDTLRIADNTDFTDELRIAVTTPGLPQVVAWDFGPAADNTETRRIYVLAFDAIVESDTAQVRVDIDFEPEFSAAGDPATVASQLLDLVVADTGVDSMRFALSPEDLADEPWLTGADLLPGFLLADNANPQIIYGEFLGDFGFTSEASWEAVPDLMADATFALLVDADRVTESSLIEAISDAVALHMRISEDPDLASTIWREYADTTLVGLSDGAGRKVVYAQFRNDWAQSAVFNDWVDYINQPLEVHFLAPPEDAILRAGGSLQVSGVAFAPSGGAVIDLVEIDLGDGEGFRAASGTNYWTYLWDVPEFVEDTPLVVRARATSGEESVTSVLNVTVTQLAVTIAEPLDGADLNEGSTYAVSGTAKPALDGAPIDSVAVYTGAERLLVLGLEDWSASWSTSDVTEDTPVDITATMYAGSESAFATITVNVIDTSGQPGD